MAVSINQNVFISIIEKKNDRNKVMKINERWEELRKEPMGISRAKRGA